MARSEPDAALAVGPLLGWEGDRLLLSWHPSGGLRLDRVPIHLAIHGDLGFRVWGSHEAGLDQGVCGAGESAPAWAEAGACWILPRAGCTCRIDAIVGPGLRGCRARICDERAAVEVEVVASDGVATWRIAVGCAPEQWALPLPVCAVSLVVEGLDLGTEATWTGSAVVPADPMPEGRIADLAEPGVSFLMWGAVAQSLPVVALARPDGQGWLWEAIAPDRAHARLERGDDGRARWTLAWPLSRQLQPGQWHHLGGSIRLLPFVAGPLQALRDWRDAAAGRGMRPPARPAWVDGALIAEVDLNPEHGGHAFRRLDDPGLRELFVRLRDMGYTAIYAVGCFAIGPGGWLSPVDYEPREDLGGRAAEVQMLAWAHELGLHIFLWLTTVGVDRFAPQVREHPHRFTRRRDGGHYYAWDASDKPGFVGYAPDADPESASWRRWLSGQMHAVVGRGYDGVFIDGILARSDNHERASWPGLGRNGVDAQCAGLSRELRERGGELFFHPEDASCSAQLYGHMVIGRYTMVPPRRKRDACRHDLFGWCGAKKIRLVAAEEIAPEETRRYLQIRYASLLPGVRWSDFIEGYLGEAYRPWAMQALLAGSTIKTHSQYVEDPGRHLAHAGHETTASDREPANRLRGHAEFTVVLRFCRDDAQIRAAPLSIEAVQVAGDQAVVGLLRPSPRRCVLALLQFAGRPARVRLRLVAPSDLPRCELAAAGRPHERSWRVREALRSMVDSEALAPRDWVAGAEVTVDLAAFGMRVLVLDAIDALRDP